MARHNTRAYPRALMRAGKRAWARLMAREAFGSWFAPLLIVAAVAALHQAGLFRQIDGRFFDAATLNEQGTAAKVVVIERDTPFEGSGTTRFDRLDAALAGLGVERIGYLGQRPASLADTPVPVVIGLPAQRVPASKAWKLAGAQETGDRNSTVIEAARVLAPAQYGINRSQIASLAGVEGSLPVFDATLAGVRPAQNEYLVRTPRRQSIPVLRASQVIEGQLGSGELVGTVALVGRPDALDGRLITPLTPTAYSTSEAIFRAHSVNTLRGGRAAYPAGTWEAWLLLGIAGLVLALAYRRIDAKRLALVFPLAISIMVIGGSWAALQFAGKLLPVSALLLAPWLVTFQRIIAREKWQDRRLDEASSRAVQLSFRRSALREGANLPQLIGHAARLAGVERSLVFERRENGSLQEISAHDASLDDIALEQRKLAPILGELRQTLSPRDAADLVPGWEAPARIDWMGGGEHDLYWIHTRPGGSNPGKSAQLIRAIAASFRELLKWRANLNARSRQDERFKPIDERVASAIALVARESEQIRHGFDTADTAVMIFHLIGSPLHANAKMQDIYRDAGLVVSDSSLPDVLAALTELDEPRIEAMLHDLMLNGGEMRMPMRKLGPEERVLRLAAPARRARSADRVLVLEAIDVSDLLRASDLRQAVALFIDLQLRNDFEAILLGADLAGDDRITGDKIKPIVRRIGDTARRATARLDEVAELVRAENKHLVDASYPVDARKVVSDVRDKAAAFAAELGVKLDVELPGVSGFTIAEPRALAEMLEAMLRVVIADTPQGDTVQLKLEELEARTHIRVSGGFGIGFGRLMWLMSNYEAEAVGEYRVIGEGLNKVTAWGASVSYWGREADGFGFNVDLRRIG
ncbi:hypothetical protein [Altererythrobacter sp.]